MSIVGGLAFLPEHGARRSASQSLGVPPELGDCSNRRHEQTLRPKRTSQYLTPAERDAFLKGADDAEVREDRIFHGADGRRRVRHVHSTSLVWASVIPGGAEFP